jgi:hypothetical protein
VVSSIGIVKGISHPGAFIKSGNAICGTGLYPVEYGVAGLIEVMPTLLAAGVMGPLGYDTGCCGECKNPAVVIGI